MTSLAIYQTLNPVNLFFCKVAEVVNEIQWIVLTVLNSSILICCLLKIKFFEMFFFLSTNPLIIVADFCNISRQTCCFEEKKKY